MRNPALTIAISRAGDHNRYKPLLNSIDQQVFDQRFEVLEAGPCELSKVGAMRNELYFKAQGSVVFFIDEDCVLPDPYFLKRLCEVIGISKSAVGGAYKGGVSIWQRSYNLLVKIWLELHDGIGNSVPVAGNFAVMKKYISSSKAFPFSDHAGFGGEEISLKQNFVLEGFEFKYCPDLAVEHYPDMSMTRFFSRAWLHGRSPRMPGNFGSGASLLAGLVKRNFFEPQALALVFSYLLVVQVARLIDSLWTMYGLRR